MWVLELQHEEDGEEKMVATENNAGERYMLPLLDVKWVMLHMEEEQFDMLSTLDVECNRLPMDEKLSDTLGSDKTTYQMMVQRLKVAFARFKYCLPPSDYLEHDEAVTVRVAAGAPLPTQQLSSSPPNTIPSGLCLHEEAAAAHQL